MSKNYKVVVIDDEAPARDLIKHYLQKDARFNVVAECSNGFEGIKVLHELTPDVVFLDVQMPKLTGFEMLELMEDLPVIIFSTAFDQYALKAFEVNAVDYLLKPYSQDRFREAVEKALAKLQDRDSNRKRIAGLIAHHHSLVEYLERIVVKSGSHIYIIPIEKVLFLEAQDDYVMLNTKEGPFLKQKTMKFFEEHLDPKEFVRIHRSYIVKISLIKKIELFAKESYRVLLANGKTLPVSKSGHTRLKEMFN
ncbi:MAG: LytR/AlgR family response regulator transcription factor [bacterium]